MVPRNVVGWGNPRQLFRERAGAINVWPAAVDDVAGDDNNIRFACAHLFKEVVRSVVFVMQIGNLENAEPIECLRHIWAVKSVGGNHNIVVAPMEPQQQSRKDGGADGDEDVPHKIPKAFPPTDNLADTALPAGG